MRLLAVNLFWLLFLASCKPDEKFELPYRLMLPEGFEQPYIPADNPLSASKIELGRKLFFDPVLSKDSTISCASCHFQQFAFADSARLSKGVHDSLGFRNAMALTNVAYGVSFFRDGGVPSLELQVVAPIVAENEMNETIDNVVNKLSTHQYYSKTFRSVFGEDVSLSSITKAIASFERTLISGNSDYDKQFYQSQNVMSESALRGKALFFSERLNCTKCHSGFNFSNNLFENNGLYKVYQDPGRRRVTVRVQDDGKFKVPSLRNVELTAPYMHDGSLKSLEDVIEHYNTGGSNHPQKSKFITSLNLSSQEKADVVNFLKSLSDKEFISNPSFTHP